MQTQECEEITEAINGRIRLMWAVLGEHPEES